MEDAERARLHGILRSLAERCFVQHEVLARSAEGKALARYRCGCRVLPSTKIQAFCPVHYRGMLPQAEGVVDERCRE